MVRCVNFYKIIKIKILNNTFPRKKYIVQLFNLFLFIFIFHKIIILTINKKYFIKYCSLCDGIVKSLTLQTFFFFFINYYLQVSTKIF